MTESNDGTRIGMIRFRIEQLMQRTNLALEEGLITEQSHTEVVSILENLEGHIDFLEQNNIGT